MYKFKNLLLDNKLKVLLIPNKETKLITFRLNLSIGNDVEIDKESLEIGHFIEHLFCLYTSTKYPDGAKNREVFYFKNIDVQAEITDKNIKFSLEFEKKNTNLVIDILTNALLDFRLDKKMFIKEKNAVIEELNEIINDEEYLINEKIVQTIYKNTPREFTQKERLDNTKKLKPQAVLDYFNKFFRAGNMLFTIFGNISLKQRNLLFKKLNQIPRGVYKHLNYTTNFKNKIIYLKKKSQGSHLKFLFRVNYSGFSRESFHLHALNIILTEDMNSILLKELRTNKGLIYSVFGDLTLDNVSKDYGIYEISTIIDSKNILKAIESFLKIFNELKSNKLDNKYFVNLREKNNIFYLKETFSINPELIIKNYSMYALWNKPILSLKDELNLYNQITPELFQKYSREIFNKKNMIICYESQTNLDKEIKKLLSI